VIGRFIQLVGTETVLSLTNILVLYTFGVFLVWGAWVLAAMVASRKSDKGNS